jgi:hypothetical protein
MTQESTTSVNGNASGDVLLLSKLDLVSAHEHRQNLRAGSIYEQLSFSHKMRVSITCTEIDQYLPILCMESMLAWFPHFLSFTKCLFSDTCLLERHRVFLKYTTKVRKESLSPMAGGTHLCNNVMNTTSAKGRWEGPS